MFRIISRLLDWLRSLLWKNEMEITIVGLQQAGKTTLVNVIAKDRHIETVPTIGFNTRHVTYGRTVIKIWDLGGERRFRGMWERYCRGVSAILYMVDAADLESMKESTRELHCLLKKPQLMHVPILVLGNKTDLPDVVSENDLIAQMELEKIENRNVCCYMISCKQKDNIDKVLQWLLKLSQSRR